MPTVALLMLVGMAIALLVALHHKKRMKEEAKRLRQETGNQRKMLKAALEAQESERRRLAKDLHDNLGMMLMTMRVNLNSLPGGQAAELLPLVDQTHESVQRISWGLMPPTLDNFGLPQSIQEMCKRLSKEGATEISYREVGRPLSLDKDQELLIFRIAQEACCNALKHARASNIAIGLVWGQDGLQLTVTDNGVGFDLAGIKHKVGGRHGLGLYNMENRVALLGGGLDFKKNNPSGTVVSVVVPLT